MKIEEIDKNFATKVVEIDGDKITYSIPHEKFDLYGVTYDEAGKCFTRLPKEKCPNVREHLINLGKCTAGGRLRFSTDSEYFGIEIGYEKLSPMTHMPLSGSCGFTLLLEEEDGTLVRMAGFRPDIQGCETGYSRTAKLPGGRMRRYILHFPLYHAVSSLKITLSATARVEHGKRYKPLAPILYYGSSITQGGCASRPDNAYQGLIAKWNNVDFINLGFSGNAKAEDEMVDYLASIDCSLFVCDYDHNAPHVEYLRATHHKMYKKIREKNPDIPYFMISKPNFNYSVTDTARRAVIMQSYVDAWNSGDRNVYFIDGEEFYGPEERYLCSIDNTHPNSLGFLRMANIIEPTLKKILGIRE